MCMFLPTELDPSQGREILSATAGEYAFSDISPVLIPEKLRFLAPNLARAFDANLDRCYALCNQIVLHTVEQGIILLACDFNNLEVLTCE